MFWMREHCKMVKHNNKLVSGMFRRMHYMSLPVSSSSCELHLSLSRENMAAALCTYSHGYI